MPAAPRETGIPEHGRKRGPEGEPQEPRRVGQRTPDSHVIPRGCRHDGDAAGRDEESEPQPHHGEADHQVSHAPAAVQRQQEEDTDEGDRGAHRGRKPRTEPVRQPAPHLGSGGHCERKEQESQSGALGALPSVPSRKKGMTNPRPAPDDPHRHDARQGDREMASAHQGRWGKRIGRAALHGDERCHCGGAAGQQDEIRFVSRPSVGASPMISRTSAALKRIAPEDVEDLELPVRRHAAGAGRSA